VVGNSTDNGKPVLAYVVEKIKKNIDVIFY